MQTVGVSRGMKWLVQYLCYKNDLRYASTDNDREGGREGNAIAIVML